MKQKERNKASKSKDLIVACIPMARQVKKKKDREMDGKPFLHLSNNHHFFYSFTLSSPLFYPFYSIFFLRKQWVRVRLEGSRRCFYFSSYFFFFSFFHDICFFLGRPPLCTFIYHQFCRCTKLMVEERDKQKRKIDRRGLIDERKGEISKNRRGFSNFTLKF